MQPADAGLPRVKRILVAIGAEQRAGRLLSRASALARHFGAAVRLCASVYDPHLGGEGRPDSEERRAARATLIAGSRATLERLAALLRDQQLPDVSVQAAWSYPVHAGLAAEARAFGADLLIAATFQQSAEQRAGLAHADWHLVRTSPCPVLLVRSAGEGYRQILIPVDPTHAHDKPAALDETLIGWARQLGAPGNAQLQLLHCFMPPEYLPMTAPGAALGSLLSRPGKTLEGHREALGALAARHGIAAVNVHLEAGDPRELIPEAALRQRADLVIMGVVSRSRLRQLLVGSTAESVLDRLECDVLAVKPPADLSHSPARRGAEV